MTTQEPSRQDLLGLVRQAYVEGDPVPTGLVARMQAAVAGAAEEAGLGLDLELMLLVESSGAAAVRSTAAPGAKGRAAYTLRFERAGIDVLVRVAPDGDDTARLDGWVVPAEPVTVRVVRADKVAAVVAAEPSGSGRFELSGLPTGLVRLRFEAQDSGRPTFLTPTFEI
ncbi:MAG: hypothetical protein J2O46_00970 [Nocardioides sp.]|nr:hypothetical protein [Nocardioides sp.]